MEIQGTLDTSDIDPGGNAAGNIVINGERVEVNQVDTRAWRSDGQGANGYVDLRALSAYAGFDSTSAANAFTNRLILNGSLRLAGAGPNINGIVRIHGVVAQLNAGFNLGLPAQASLAFRVGLTNLGSPAHDLLINASAQDPTVNYIVHWNGVVPGGLGPSFTTSAILRAAACVGLAYHNSMAGTATDANGGALTYAKGAGPAWLIVTGDGTMSGTPGVKDTFTNEWIVSVTDGTWTQAALLQINVCGAPKFRSDPVVQSPAWTHDNFVNAGQTLAGSAASPCGAPLTFAKVSGPGWLNVAADGTLSGTPLAANLGTNAWTVSVSDGTDTATTSLRIVVPTPIVITSQERWDGTRNPRAAQGVILTGSGTTADPAVYTIPTHLRIATGGSIVMSVPPPAGGQDVPPDHSIVLKFTGYDLKLETNAYINIGRRARTGSKTANFSLGGGSILGSGQIRGVLNSVSSPRVLTIEDVRNVSLASIDLHVENVANGGRHLNLTASGKVEIGSIDNSDVQDTGGDGGDVNLSAGVISVGTIKTFAARTSSVVKNGNIRLKALGPPLYDPNIAEANTIENRLTLSGLLSATTGTQTHQPGDITLQGVVVELKPGFGVEKRPSATFTLNAGVYPNGVGAAPANLFINGTINALTPNYVVQWTTPPTTTTVSSSTNPACPGSAVNFTASVAAVNSSTPTGTVQFKTNGVEFGSTVPLSGGTATSLPAVLPVGTTVVAAVYSGTAHHGASTSWEFIQTVRSDSAPVASDLSMVAFGNAPATRQIIGESPPPLDPDGSASPTLGRCCRVSSGRGIFREFRT